VLNVYGKGRVSSSRIVFQIRYKYYRLMKQCIPPNSIVWLITMALAGVGSTFLGPFLLCVSPIWHLHDRQTGLLLSSLFLGSFMGTMLLAKVLRRTLWLGAAMATAGLLLLSFAAHIGAGYSIGLIALLVMGFGLGQLMSSINLLVGTAVPAERSRDLANIGTAWCIGAILSPLLTTVLVHDVSFATRLALFAPAYLFPVIASKGRELPS